MIDRNEIENVLRVNGVSPSAKDEEIRSLLLTAKWTENDVDTAMMVLKENTAIKETHVDTLHKIFRSDQRLSPTEITDLLGINTTFTNSDILEKTNHPGQKIFSILIAFILSIIILVGSIGFLMYKEKAGLFHPGFNAIPK